jgi:multidrug efflux pump subunit AcrA (membrane-fusion protein)
MKFWAPARFALAAALVLTGCSGGGQKHQGPPPLAVDVTRATRHDIATYITLDGQITPLQQSTLSSTQSGTVAEVLVNEGDRVHQGELLARLDDSQLRAQLAANEALVGQSRAKLSSSQIQAPISSQQYSASVSQAAQNLEQAQNRVETDVAALKNAELVYRSNEQLAGQGYVAQTTLEQSRAAYIAAEQELHNARQGLAPAQAALQTARTNVQQTQVDRATIEQNSAALDQARANVQLLQTQIAQSSIYAPFDGVVTARLLDPGAFAGPSQPIVQVAEIDHVYVNANVPDEDLGYVRPGTAATFVSASLPGKTLHGTIFDVNAVPTTGTLSYRARLRQANPGFELRGGMLATVTVQKEARRNAVVVPRTAIFQTYQGAGVYTVVDGKAKLVPVHLGLETDTLAEVNGLSSGTIVITTRPDALQDGSVVAVANAPPAEGTVGPRTTH